MKIQYVAAVQLALILLMVGCATTSTVERHDEFEGFSIQETKGKTLVGHSVRDSAQFNLIAQKITDKSGAITYQIKVDYYGMSAGWLFIETGESLHLLINDSPVHLNGTGSQRHRDVVGGTLGVHEWATYSCEPKLIEQIAAATEVRVKLEGSRGYIERHFDDVNFQAYREFVAKYLNAEATP